MRHSIGMFDSGIGGLTVMQQLLHIMPRESIVYLGDTARLPYGEKSRETVIRYSIENAIFLLEKNIKFLVIACNTASAFALEKLQNIFNIPVIGVINPGAEKAVQVTKTGRIAVIGTKGTINSQAYQRAILQLDPKATVIPIACPLFVPLVEEQYLEHPAAKLIVQEYLRPLKEQKIDTLLMGCTHYPLLKHLINDELGPKVTIVDSAVTCAEKVAAILAQQGLENCHPEPPEYRYFVSDDPQKFQLLGQAFLDMPITAVEPTIKNLFH